MTEHLNKALRKIREYENFLELKHLRPGKRFREFCGDLVQAAGALDLAAVPRGFNRAAAWDAI